MTTLGPIHHTTSGLEDLIRDIIEEKQGESHPEDLRRDWYIQRPDETLLEYRERTSVQGYIGDW